MIRTIALVLTIIGFISLTLGILGIFGSNLVALSPWALTILGLIFFISGIGIFKKGAEGNNA